ncbi:multidrug effflux MFS transporter [Streptomyces sp. URMC 123]|uniref:multidrug effflux MFS transporter n=1 Tax=Streptomyces sp. URMC 123 TaxID=3423403 RepID=UPI003F1A3C3D
MQESGPIPHETPRPRPSAPPVSGRSAPRDDHAAPPADLATAQPDVPAPRAPVPPAAVSPDSVPPVPVPSDPSDSVTSAPPAGLAGQRRTGVLLTLILGGLTALPPLSMDMYLPAMPAVTRSLDSPAATIQLTLTACLAGMAAGQLVVGPMSDKWGRRRPLLVGMVIYVVATLMCAFAPTAELLIAFRLLQGLAGAAGIVIARAVVRDLYDGVEMARFFSSLMLISGLAPIIAPVVGGQVLRVTDWRGVFVLLAAIGALLSAVVKWRLAETLPPAARHGGGLGATLRTMRGLIADRVFTGYVLSGSFTFAALFSYISASPFVFQDIYGASPQTFSLLFGTSAVGVMVVGQLNGRLLVGRVRLDKALAAGLGLSTLAAVGALLLVSGAFGETGLLPVALSMIALVAPMGLVMPNTSAQALMRTPHAAGSASALLGTASFLVGAVVSPLVGIAGEGTAVPMTVVQTGCLVVAIGCFLGFCRPWRRNSTL